MSDNSRWYLGQLQDVFRNYHDTPAASRQMIASYTHNKAELRQLHSLPWHLLLRNKSASEDRLTVCVDFKWLRKWVSNIESHQGPLPRFCGGHNRVNTWVNRIGPWIVMLVGHILRSRTRNRNNIQCRKPFVRIRSALEGGNFKYPEN